MLSFYLLVDISLVGGYGLSTVSYLYNVLREQVFVDINQSINQSISEANNIKLVVQKEFFRNS